MESTASSLSAMAAQWCCFPRGWEDITTEVALVAMLFAVATIVGWFQSKDLIVRRFGNLNAALRLRKSSGSEVAISSQGFGGIGYLLLRRAIKQALISIVVIVCISWIWKLTDAPSRSYDMLYVYIAILVGFDMMSWLPHLRPLRTLPLSRRSLVHLLVFWSPACITIFYAIASRIVFFICGNFAIVWHWDSVFLAAVLPTLLLPLFLRFGFEWWTMMTFMPLFILPVLLSDFHAGWLLVLVAGVAVLAFVWTLTYRLLGSAHPWRAGAFKPSKGRGAR